MSPRSGAITTRQPRDTQQYRTSFRVGGGEALAVVWPGTLVEHRRAVDLCVRVAVIVITLVHKIYYGHIVCHALHQDYVVAPGHDYLAIEHRMWDLLAATGARYPADHNTGHPFPAELQLAEFYRALDPDNSFNAGIDGISKKRVYEPHSSTHISV